MQRKEQWISVERPGYLGKRKDEKERQWNQRYGQNGWRLVWQTNNSELLTYQDIFWKVYVPGYSVYFQRHLDEATFITANYAYGYDKDLIEKAQAFDPEALVNKPGVINQFHNVAFNIALEWYLGLPFKGSIPLQVRDGGRSIPVDQKPTGWRWSPGRIPTVRPDLIPNVELTGWWQPNTIEDFYQKTKVLQILS